MATAEKKRWRTGIAGYRVLPHKFEEEDEDEGLSFMYFKQHRVRDPHPLKPNDKTLILLNVPPYCDEKCLTRLFSVFGEVTAVHLHKKPTAGVDEVSKSKFFKPPPIEGYKVAYIVFKLENSAIKAVNEKFTSPWILSTKDAPLLVGVEKWAKEYADSIPDPDELLAECNEYLENYFKTTTQEREMEKKKADEPDEDGWVTVSSRGKRKGFARTETNVEKINKKETKKRAQRELLNFYTFQIKDTKRDHIDQLRKKFEEDKKKIATLKASRKFKPY